MLPKPQFFQFLCNEWVNNTHLPVILAMVEVFRKKFAGMNLLPGHWTATQVVTSAQPCQSLGRLGRNHFFLKNHLKPLNHQVFSSRCGDAPQPPSFAPKSRQEVQLSFLYGHKYGPMQFCQLVNGAYGGVGAPDDSRRLQQGWVKIKIQPRIGLPNMSKRGTLSLIADTVAAVYACRSSRLSSCLACKYIPHSSKANGSLLLLPNLGIPPQIDQMSRFNARPL